MWCIWEEYLKVHVYKTVGNQWVAASLCLMGGWTCQKKTPKVLLALGSLSQSPNGSCCFFTIQLVTLARWLWGPLSTNSNGFSHLSAISWVRKYINHEDTYIHLSFGELEVCVLHTHTTHTPPLFPLNHRVGILLALRNANCLENFHLEISSLLLAFIREKREWNGR